MSFLSRIILALFFAAILISNAVAQRFNVRWGDNSRLNFDFVDAVPLANGQFIVLKLKHGPKMSFGKPEDLRPIFVLVDKNMESIREKEIEIEEKNATDRGFEKYGNNFYFIYEAYDKESKTTSVYALKVNEKTLEVEAKATLGTYASDSRYNQAGPSYKMSSDSTKILLFVEGAEAKKENKKFYVAVYETNLTLVWKKEIELPIGDRYVSIYDKDITNDGKVYVAIKHYDKEVSRETVMEDGEKIPSYTYKLLVYDATDTQGKEILVELNNHFIQGTKLSYNKNGSIVLAGLYKRKHNGNINGAFYSILDATTKEIKDPKMVPFPPEMISMIDNDNFGSDKSSDPGLYPGFKIRHIRNRSNGSVDLIAEYYKEVYSTQHSNINGSLRVYQTTSYTYGDIVNTNINAEGKAVFTRIPKNQKFNNFTPFLGFYPIVYGDKLVLLYNDDVDNVERDIEMKPDDVVNFKRSVFLAATVDAKGNVSRQSLYSHVDEDYITFPKSTAKISDTKYLLVSDLLKLTKKRTRFGVLDIK
jgi:hypothetical protein